MRLIVTFVLLLLALPSSARAAISLRGDTTFTRTDARGRPAGEHVLSLEPKGINLRDCVEDQRVHWPLALTDWVPDGTVEAWVSNKDVDCQAKATRERECVKAGDSITPSAEMDVTLPVRSMVAPITSKTTSPATIASCTTTVERADIRVHFLHFARTNDDAPLFATSTILPVDLVLPHAAPAPIIKPGAPWASLHVSWSPSSEANTRTNIYCVKLSASNSVDGNPATCSPVGFKAVDARIGKEAPVIPTAGFDASFLCATSSVEEPDSMTLLPSRERAFEEGGVYAFAIARVDAFGNVGELSSTTCYEPERFQQEQCSFVSPACLPSSMTPFTLLMLGVILLRRRRRPRDHQRASR